jgi:hypothetical protein
MNYTKLVASLALATCSSWASAGIIIDSINVKMAKTPFRVGSTQSYDSARADFDTAFSGSAGYCDLALEAFTGIESRKTCGGSDGGFGALYTITGTNNGTTSFEFGLDWGRGGFLVTETQSGTSIEKVTQDIWWAKNWDNSLEYTLSEQGRFTLTLLGFENCCDGINSARYKNSYIRSGELLQDVPAGVAFDTKPGISGANQPLPVDDQWASTTLLPLEDQWQDLRVNAVPLPGSLPLLAVGGLILWRRRSPQAVS